jgi:hypothetical protein
VLRYITKGGGAYERLAPWLVRKSIGTKRQAPSIEEF